MIQIAAWLGTLWGRMALGGGVVVALVGLRAWDVRTQQAAGARKAVAKMEAKANENARKADDARRSVDRLPADRLRDRFTRD
jgi:hypothetical protein